MRYEVQQQLTEINNALSILCMRDIPNFQNPSEEEMEFALKIAQSCMTVMISTLSKHDITLKEFYNELYKKNTR